MLESYVLEEGETLTLEDPRKPEWECRIGPSFHIQLEDAPNWLGRWLQKVFLDIHWVKL